MTCCPSELHDTERLFKACFGQLLWLTTWPASMCGRPCSSLSRTSTHPASSSCVLKALVVGLFARVGISVQKCTRIVWWCSCYPNYALTGRINSIYCNGSKRHQACCCPHLCFFARVSRYMSTWMYTWHFLFMSCSIDLCTSVYIYLHFLGSSHLLLGQVEHAIPVSTCCTLDATPVFFHLLSRQQKPFIFKPEAPSWRLTQTPT